MELQYTYTQEILTLVSSVSEKLGRLSARIPGRVSPEARKQIRTDTIHATMQLEGKSLQRETTADIIEKRPVIGLQTRIREINNIGEVYNQLSKLNPCSEESLFSAHRVLMAGIGEEAGRYRTTDAAIFRGKRIIKMAPSPEKVPCTMDELFVLLNSKEENILIKSCIAHYTMEYLQPFWQANGMMGRLWQTLLLIQEYELFEYLPWEKQVLATREDYYRALKNSEEAGQSEEFIKFMLGVISISLETIPTTSHRSLSDSDRILFFHELGMHSFARKDYMKVFTSISSATASRDLSRGVDAGLFERKGTKNVSLYSCI